MSTTTYTLELSWRALATEDGRRPDERLVASYDNLVDGLREAGKAVAISLLCDPAPTRCEDAGGWARRETGGAFVSFASTLMLHFCDRVDTWEVRATVAENPAATTSAEFYLTPNRSAEADGLAAAYFKALAAARLANFARALPQGIDFRACLSTADGRTGGLVGALRQVLATGTMPDGLAAYTNLKRLGFRVTEDDFVDFGSGRPALDDDRRPGNRPPAGSAVPTAVPAASFS